MCHVTVLLRALWSLLLIISVNEQYGRWSGRMVESNAARIWLCAAVIEYVKHHADLASSSRDMPRGAFRSVNSESRVYPCVHCSQIKPIDVFLCWQLFLYERGSTFKQLQDLIMCAAQFRQLPLLPFKRCLSLERSIIPFGWDFSSLLPNLQIDEMI